MQRISVVCRRAGLVAAGLVSIGLGVRGTAMLVRPDEIEFVPTGMLLGFVCLFALPLMTLWALRTDNETVAREAPREPISDDVVLEMVRPLDAQPASHRVVHAAQTRRDRAGSGAVVHRPAAEAERPASTTEA